MNTTPALPYIDPHKLIGHDANGEVYSGRVTRTGRLLDVLNPQPDQIDILDITSGLAYQCRFTGQTSRFYSIAAHSLLVSYLVPEDIALYGLLHDASEAYLNDISRPVKLQLGPEYKKMEALVQQAIFDRFGLGDCGVPAVVKQADNVAVCLEQKFLLPDVPAWPHALTDAEASAILKDFGLEYEDFDSTPDEQGTLFLTRFRELYHGKV